MPVQGEEFLLLPDGGNVYIWADAVEGRPLLDVLSPISLSNADVAQVIDRTETFVAALYPEDQDRRFFLAAVGSFPSTRANFSFTFSRGWRRHSSQDGGNYWYSAAENIAIALNPDLVRLSNTDPIRNFTPQLPPQGFSEFASELPLAGWMPEASGFLDRFLQTLGVPLQIPAEDFFFGAHQPWQDPEDASYWELVFRIRTPSELHARSLLALFTLARVFVLSGMVPSEGFVGGTSINMREFASLLFAYLPELEGDMLRLRSNPITTEQIALLFMMFSIYSN